MTFGIKMADLLGISSCLSNGYYVTPNRVKNAIFRTHSCSYSKSYRFITSSKIPNFVWLSSLFKQKMSSLKFNMFKNNDSIKDLVMDTNTANWEEYRSTLNIFKKRINEYLTQQVELDKVTGDSEADVDEDSESSEDEKGFKRILGTPNSFEKNNKIPKT